MSFSSALSTRDRWFIVKIRSTRPSNTKQGAQWWHSEGHCLALCWFTGTFDLCGPSISFKRADPVPQAGLFLPQWVLQGAACGQHLLHTCWVNPQCLCLRGSGWVKSIKLSTDTKQYTATVVLLQECTGSPHVLYLNQIPLTPFFYFWLTTL